MKKILQNKKVTSISTLVFGAGLMVAGFVMPPTGIIDGSVLTGVGLLFGFSASIDGIDYLRQKNCTNE